MQVLTRQVSDMDIFDADVTSLQLANMCNGRQQRAMQCKFSYGEQLQGVSSRLTRICLMLAD